MGARGERALGGARDVGFCPRGGAQGTRDATELCARVGEGGSPAVSVGRADSRVRAQGDAPAFETVFGSTFEMSQAERKINRYFVFEKTEKLTSLLGSLKQFAMSRLE